MNKHHQWMKRALLLAKKAQAEGEVPVGALLVKDEQVIGEGFNQPILSHDPSAHAEIVALRGAGAKLNNYRLVDTTMYVTLEPCAMCAMAMVHARVSRLVFAAEEPRTGAAGSLYQLLKHQGHNHQIEVIEGVLASESATMLKDFFKARRKKNKS
jgi:tRNA(adenine34) deaminase